MGVERRKTPFYLAPVDYYLMAMLAGSFVDRDRPSALVGRVARCAVRLVSEVERYFAIL